MPTKGLYRVTNTEGKARWYVRIVIDGRLQRFAPHGGFTTEKHARAFLTHARADIERGKFFPDKFRKDFILPLTDLLTEQTARLPTTANSKNDRTYQAWWIQHFGKQDARLLTAAHLDQARGLLTAAGKSPQTIHHVLKFLRRRLNLALRDDIIERSPFQKARLAPVHNERVRFYTEEERRKLYQALGPEWRQAAELAGLTGLRWAEQFRLTRQHIHLDEGFLELPTTKAGRPQARLLNQRAKEILRDQLARHTLPWLYPNPSETGPVEYSNWLKSVWIPAREAAGVANARWNDWRHTFASDLTMAGHSDRTVAALLGHTSTQMVKRYAHLADAHLRAAVESIAIPLPSGSRPTRTPSRK